MKSLWKEMRKQSESYCLRLGIRNWDRSGKSGTSWSNNLEPRGYSLGGQVGRERVRPSGQGHLDKETGLGKQN